MNNDGKLLDSIHNLTDVDLKALVRWLSRAGIVGGIAGIKKHGSDSWPITKQIVSTYSHGRISSIAAWSNSVGVMAAHAD